MEQLTISPFTRPASGTVSLPGSKSITNRALILAALSRESLTLEGALFSEDTEIMISALKALGFTLSPDPAGNSIFIVGRGGYILGRDIEINVGNAGTAARFLTAMLALKPRASFRLDGSEAMRKRPMKGLLDVLTHNGAIVPEFSGEPGFFPFEIKTRGLFGGTLSVDASASSQILSALLMVAPLAGGPTTVELTGETVSRPFIDMTLTMMAQFGTEPKSVEHGRYHFAGEHSYYCARPAYVIEPDATAASYFMALPWVTGGSLRLQRMGNICLQGDIGFTEVMAALGMDSQTEDEDLVVSPKSAPAGDIPASFDFNAISDTFLTLAAISPLLEKPITITGIAHTRKQETDRVHAMATELRKLGQRVAETEDSLTITPDLAALKAATATAPVAIDTYHDHRVAMSFGILGCRNLHGDGRPWITINDPGCCAKTFPRFFEVLNDLRPS
ncbi:3-phosphoshikimate 1-carboxyvinyltransferase [Ruficoccus amylovorans]|uniref:3-phosphoshikimate 1-carboxyvinyltransferase n=1 Tax=Ruficoccus amylovorans TaxID=1804625 RepID=A0A842HHM8_9BACT|nr:3-phosphoshikimate 1-carboxyvinyltransferase [Ruficoccus amylovorans]MBC2595116.1 3-phosphoshikimate 1-carboxyvinyltransferase [Ruficoccus amylovorans]